MMYSCHAAAAVVTARPCQLLARLGVILGNSLDQSILHGLPIIMSVQTESPGPQAMAESRISLGLSR
jgi:hypothetical protein